MVGTLLEGTRGTKFMVRLMLDDDLGRGREGTDDHGIDTGLIG